jgi:thymidylate synthase (FAD)
MTVSIVAVTVPRVDGINSADEFIAYCARVSNPKNQMNTETAPKLVAYCAKHGHWSVFEMVNLIMRVETTRDIGRQILRHRSFSFQEFSQRYADPTKDLGFSMREARLQDTKNKQNSIETNDENLQKEWKRQCGAIAHLSESAYRWGIDNGIAKEQARAVLPEGLTNSVMFMNGTLRSWIHWIKVRNHPATQAEHRRLASEATGIIMDEFPSLAKLLTEIVEENFKK